MSPVPSAPARKHLNIWALASVTYGAVVVVTLFSVFAYYYLLPKSQSSQPMDEARSMAVGSVWMPVYPGATMEGTASTKQANATESTLNFATKDSADRVLAFYQDALKRGVFRFETVTKNDGGGSVRSIVHQGKTTVVVTIRTAGNRSLGEIRTVDKDTRN